MATTCLKTDKTPECVAETGFCYKKVIRKSFMYLGARKELFKKQKFLTVTGAVPRYSGSVTDPFLHLQSAIMQCHCDTARARA